MTNQKEQKGTQLVPNIRFKGFTDDWEKRKLGNIAEMYQPSPISKATLTEFGFPVFGANGYIGHYSSYNHLEDQVTISARGENTGTPNFVKGPVWITGNSMVLKIDHRKINKYFLFTNLLANPIFSFVTGGAQPQITRHTLRNISIIVPKTLEQDKLGKYFTSVDNLITVNQRKQEKLELLKKALLQRLFPNQDAKIPDIRFANFHDDWEKRKLGDFGHVAMNRRIFKEETTDSGEIPFFKIGTFGGIPDTFISREKFEDYKSRYPYPSVGDILLSASGSIGRIVEYKGEDAYFQDSNIVWLAHDKNINNKFLKQFYIIAKWVGLEGSTIRRLYNKSILSTNILIPNISEQEMLGTYFNHFDNLISVNQRKQEQLELLKKALLQQLFI